MSALEKSFLKKLGIKYQKNLKIYVKMPLARNVKLILTKKGLEWIGKTISKKIRSKKLTIKTKNQI